MNLDSKDSNTATVLASADLGPAPLEPGPIVSCPDLDPDRVITGNVVKLRYGPDFDLSNWNTMDVDIRSAIHGLSLTNRWNGQTQYPYSVAQHCVLMYEKAPWHLKPYCLLHDIGEFIFGDRIRPVRGMSEEVNRKEDKLTCQFIERMGFEAPIPEEFYWYDNAMVAVELDHFFNEEVDGAKLENVTIAEWSWRNARDLLDTRMRQVCQDLEWSKIYG